MAFSYGFFNAKNLDRVYTAEDFTSYLSSLICDGILDTYGDCFSVTANNNLTVTLGTGKAWIDGHYFINDTPYTLNLRQYVDESLNRYVVIGISCDTDDSIRECKLEVLSGTAATLPTIPTFRNTDSKTYLTLAAILLPGGASRITADQITDYRDDESKCGYVKCILGKCKVTELLETLDSIYDTVDGIRTDVTGLESGTFQSKLNTLQGQLTYVSNQVSVALTRLNTLEHQTIPALQNKINAIISNSVPEISFKSDENGLYYEINGERLTGEQEIAGIPFLFALDGSLRTGFRTVVGKRYYYDPGTGNMVLGWVTWNDDKYYITFTEGKLVNQTRTIEDEVYTFDSYGVATKV